MPTFGAAVKIFVSATSFTGVELHLSWMENTFLTLIIYSKGQIHLFTVDTLFVLIFFVYFLFKHFEIFFLEVLNLCLEEFDLIC